MTGQPLVSVMIPLYNARKTLRLALASLLAQTYEEWEAVIVDDGSTDNSLEIVKELRDPRLRSFRAEQNMGRAVARQLALDHAKGEFLCMLDADDWLYPDKIQTQVDFAMQHPGIGVVSTGMAIVDEGNSLVGVRGRAVGDSPQIFGPIKYITRPPICHAPCLIRMKEARKARYDPSFIRREDADYLFSILTENSFAVLPTITYAYAEYLSANLKDLLLSHAFERQFYLKYSHRFPIMSIMRWAASYTKSMGCLFFHTLGFGRLLTARRSLNPTIQNQEEFGSAFRRVSSVATHIASN